MTDPGDEVDVIVDVRIVGSGSETLPDVGMYDVFLVGGLIADIAPAGSLPRVGRVLDAGGGWLIPGLWDHHVHLLDWALAAQRVDLSGTGSAAEATALIAGSAIGADGLRVGAGFRDALWSDAPTLDALDRVSGNVPTYLINADLHSIWMNSAAFRREGLLPERSGVIREDDAFRVLRRVAEVDVATGDRLVADAARTAAARGIVGLVDLEMGGSAEAWRRRVESGFDIARIEFGVYPKGLDDAIDEGLRTGAGVCGRSADLVQVGPVKVITDGSLGTRTAACSHPYDGDPHNRGVLTVPPGELLEIMTRATGAGFACAIHAIGDLANTHALDAFSRTGAHGTIEHAQLVARADIPRFSRLGVGASVQPEHALDDRDAADALWRGQSGVAFPLRSLADSGANLLFGSDAPVAPLDPWHAIAAAVFRARDGRAPWHPHEAINVTTALAASTRGGSADPHRIAPGATADLVLCAADPFGASEPELRTMPVRATVLGGRLTHVG